MSEAAPIRFALITRDNVTDQLADECRVLFNRHYGVWGSCAGREREGRRVKLPMSRIRSYFDVDGGRIVTARHDGTLVGYAFATRFETTVGTVSWVTQLVVHSAYRRQGISKAILNGIWAFSGDFAWGLVSANPYAVRALEKATRRRCSPEVIAKDYMKVFPDICVRVAYLAQRKPDITATRSVVHTDFPVDLSEVPERLANVASTADWNLGNIEPAEEWLALTFSGQEQLKWSQQEWSDFMSASRDVALSAYDRMAYGIEENAHPWTKCTAHEVSTIVDLIEYKAGEQVLDFGCGDGRHAIELAKIGASVTGIDFSPRFIERARRSALNSGVEVTFLEQDCRTYRSETHFDAAICLYDVIGSFPSDEENKAIASNLVANVKIGGYVVVSVMNRTLTEKLAIHKGSVAGNPDLLLDLPASSTMETSGGIFNPKYYLSDPETGVVYRRERFEAAGQLPLEVIVRDRRYHQAELVNLCEAAGLETVIVRPVQLGHWNVLLSDRDIRAKEILYVGKRRK